MSQAEETQVQTATPVTVGKKAAKAAPVDLIAEVASEVESLSKTKALNEAVRLAENIEINYFKLGGVLQMIHQNTWFEGFETFAQYVYEKFGFQERKAKYLMEIYSELVTKQIPWAKVSHLGWTKLKDLARHLTAENVDEWVTKAENATVLELQAMLKASLSPTDGGAAPSAATTNDVTQLKFKLKADQLDTVQGALNKAKAEIGTEFDNVALETICAGFLGGVNGGTNASLADMMKQAGWEKVLEAFDTLFPEVNLTVEA